MFATRRISPGRKVRVPLPAARAESVRIAPGRKTRLPDSLAVPKPPPLDLHPRSRRAVVTVAVGDEAQEMHAAARPHLEAYARRLGADLVILDWAGHPAWPMSAKFGICRVLDHYERIAYVDADVLLRPGCVDLFALCEPDEFGWCDELAYHRLQPEHGREMDYLAFRARMGFQRVSRLPWMGNAGVYVAGRCHRDLLAPPEGPIRPGHCAEQDQINARVLDGFLAGRVRVRLLDRRANWQNWTDHGFRSAPFDAVLHWSGAGHIRGSRGEEIRKWAERFPLPAPQPTPTQIYILATTPRSGSSLLAEGLLDADLGWAEEWFQGQTTVAQGLEQMRSRGLMGGWIGAKVHGSELLRHGLAEVLPHEFPGARYIALTRSNRLRQALSMSRALQTGAYSFRQPEQTTPQYDAAQIRGCLADLARQEEAWEDYFARHKIRPLRLVYEDLATDFSGTLSRALAHLGEPHRIVPAPRLVRQADALTEDWVRRFTGGA